MDILALSARSGVSTESGEAQTRGLSQEELAFQANLDRTYISGIERGRRNTTLMSIATLARALRTRPSRLLASAGRASEAAR